MAQQDPIQHHTITIELSDPAATRTLALTLARVLPADAVVELSGTLGAGKTTFVRSLAEGLGVDPRSVSSPSFLTCNEYVVADDHDEEIPVMIHVDAYMTAEVKSPSRGQPSGIDWDEIAHDRSCMVVVEWPARLHGVDWAGRPVMRIELMHTGEHSRSATIHFAELRDVVEHDLVEALATMRSDMPGASSLAPFPTEREQMADLYKWLSGQYTVSRPLDPDDFEEV